MTEVVLVNEADEQIGTMEKMAAHRNAVLHRAFSVFIFNSKGEMLLHQRALKKYHSGGLWTNACCSHPNPGENVEDAATRRLQEELGFNTPLQKIFSFTYKASVENGLIEYEYDHVFAGEYSGEMKLNSEEVAAVAYYAMNDIRVIMKENPSLFTAWFKLAFPQVEGWWEERSKKTAEKEGMKGEMKAA